MKKAGLVSGRRLRIALDHCVQISNVPLTVA